MSKIDTDIYVNEEDIRFLDGPDTGVKDGDQVTIVPAIAGGCSSGKLQSDSR